VGGKQDNRSKMISHKHKTVFVHIPKVAGQSVEQMYLADLGLNWSERAVLLLRPKNCFTRAKNWILLLWHSKNGRNGNA